MVYDIITLSQVEECVVSWTPHLVLMNWCKVFHLTFNIFHILSQSIGTQKCFQSNQLNFHIISPDNCITILQPEKCCKIVVKFQFVKCVWCGAWDRCRWNVWRDPGRHTDGLNVQIRGEHSDQTVNYGGIGY